MQQTTNYNLNLIENSDKVLDSITKMNENAIIIDEELKKMNDEKSEGTFIAVYGITTFSEIQTAVNIGKTVLLDYGGTHRLQLTYISAGQFNFAGFVDAGNTIFNAVCKSTNEWILESNTYAPAYSYGIEDLEAGVSELATGHIHLTYE